MFYVFFGGIALFATRVAAIGVWALWDILLDKHAPNF